MRNVPSISGGKLHGFNWGSISGGEFLLSTDAEDKRFFTFYQNFACRAAGRPTSGHIAKQSIVYNQLGAIPLWPSGAVNGHEL